MNTQETIRFHQGAPVGRAGEPLKSARAAVILVHGRGAGAEDMLELARAIRVPGAAYLAPQAAGNTWYPFSFLEPLERNEPWLSSALELLGGLMDELTMAGMPRERIMLLGFSQGACLALEFTARQGRKLGAVAGLSGGLIGPEGTPRDYTGSLEGTPVFLGCSNRDPHIPGQRVHETAQVLEGMGAQVDVRIYPNMGHEVNKDELTAVKSLLSSLAARG